MTPETIAELFIKSAEVDRKLPDTARPAALKAMNFGYIHTFADINGWSEEEKKALNWAWLDPEKLRPSKNDIGLYEAAMELIKLAPVENQRRALWAWAMSKAGGISLAKWCRTVENIKPATAEWRAKAAIRAIHHKMCGNHSLHNVNDIDQDLRQGPEISDKTDIIGVWRPEESKPLRCHFDTDIAGIDWAEMQHAKRRERDARRRKAA